MLSSSVKRQRRFSCVQFLAGLSLFPVVFVMITKKWIIFLLLTLIQCTTKVNQQFVYTQKKPKINLLIPSQYVSYPDQIFRYVSLFNVYPVSTFYIDSYGP